jgi:hypothetical protein
VGIFERIIPSHQSCWVYSLMKSKALRSDSHDLGYSRRYGTWECTLPAPRIIPGNQGSRI